MSGEEPTAVDVERMRQELLRWVTLMPGKLCR